MPDLLQTTLDVSHKGDIFVFKIPSLLDELKVGGRMRALRAKTDPEWNGFVGGGLDADTAFILRASATFEVLLQRGPEWVFSPSKDGKPVVDIEKIGLDHNDDIYAVYQGYVSVLDSFRNRGAADANADGKEAVARSQDPQ